MSDKTNMQCTYNVTVRTVRTSTVAVEKQQVLHILSVCLCNVKGDDPDKKGYPGPPGWRVCNG